MKTAKTKKAATAVAKSTIPPATQAPILRQPIQFRSLRDIPQTVQMPETLTEPELAEILDGIIGNIRQSDPATILRAVNKLEIVSRQKPFRMEAPMEPYPKNGDPMESAAWIEQILARALHQTVEPKTPQDCFGAKNISLAAEEAGIKLPSHLSSRRLGADAGRRIALLRGVKIAF